MRRTLLVLLVALSGCAPPTAPDPSTPRFARARESAAGVSEAAGHPGGFKVKAAVLDTGITFTLWSAPQNIDGWRGDMAFTIQVGTLSGQTDDDYGNAFPMYDDERGTIPDLWVYWEELPHGVRFTVPRVAPWSITLYRFEGWPTGLVGYTFTGGEPPRAESRERPEAAPE
jgi:hypothetical protein